jgi:hypothetical protein
MKLMILMKILLVPKIKQMKRMKHLMSNLKFKQMSKAQKTFMMSTLQHRSFYMMNHLRKLSLIQLEAFLQSAIAKSENCFHPWVTDAKPTEVEVLSIQMPKIGFWTSLSHLVPVSL